MAQKGHTVKQEIAQNVNSQMQYSEELVQLMDVHGKEFQHNACQELEKKPADSESNPEDINKVLESLDCNQKKQTAPKGSGREQSRTRRGP